MEEIVVLFCRSYFLNNVWRNGSTWYPALLPAPTWQLITVGTSSLRGSHALFWLPWGLHVCSVQTQMKVKYYYLLLLLTTIIEI